MSAITQSTRVWELRDCFASLAMTPSLNVLSPALGARSRTERKEPWTSAPLLPPAGSPAKFATGASAVWNCSTTTWRAAERYNPALNAVVAWQVDQARERARDADAALARGEVWGPLHGVPMTVKESFDVAGLPTTWGNPLWQDNIAAGNAVVVERLLAAGAVIYGKTNVPLLLMDSQSYNEVYGTTNNPWDTARGPGGSSGGEAAALAAGLSALGAGSDIAGSLRNPAHYCGVYGHKPSWGIVPMRGHSAAGTLTPTDISVVGPMARYAEDLELAMRILAGPDVLQQGWRIELPPPRHRRLGDFRVGLWLDSPLCEIDASVRDRFAVAVSALLAAGATRRRDGPAADRRRGAAPAVHAAVARRHGRPPAGRGFRGTARDRRGVGAGRHEFPGDDGARCDDRPPRLGRG